MKRLDKYVLLEQKEYDRLMERITNMEGEGSHKASVDSADKQHEEKASSQNEESLLDQLKSISQKEESIDKEGVEQLKDILSQEVHEKPVINGEGAKISKSKRPPPPPGIPDKKRKINPYQNHQWKKFWSVK